MRQYWINFKGTQQGPMSLEELSKLGLDDSAYVWHSGLPDWVKITSVPELNDMLNGNNVIDEIVPELPQDDNEESEVVVNPDATLPSSKQDTKGASIPDEVPELDNVIHDANGPVMAEPYAGPQAYATQQAMPVEAEQVPDCPPTNLVWAIIATLLCCSLPGIVGIVFAFMTKKYYREGNYKKAQRMSDYGAWAVIISIMLGIISMPLSCAMSFVKMGV